MGGPGSGRKKGINTSLRHGNPKALRKMIKKDNIKLTKEGKALGGEGKQSFMKSKKKNKAIW
jgi:hypothetical protein